MNPPTDDLDDIDGVTASSDQARRLLSCHASPEQSLVSDGNKNSSAQQQATVAKVRPLTELTRTENHSNSDLDMAGLSPTVERPLAFKQGPRRLFIARHGERVNSCF